MQELDEYQVVQRKVYDRVYSLNQLIKNFYWYILFLYIYKEIFFHKPFLKLIGKKLQWSEFYEIGIFASLTEGIKEVQSRVKAG